VQNLELVKEVDGLGAQTAHPSRRLSERFIEAGLFLAAASSILITFAIIGILLFESSVFFKHVSLVEFLTDSQWTPMFENAHFGILPLLCGTFVITAVALLFAVPAGTIIAVWISEYANPVLREVLKPALELVAAVPTVVFGYFALLFVTPLLQQFIPNLPGFNMLSAGLVIGIMIVPYVVSVAEDAMRAVPKSLRDASYALGGNKFQTSWQVVLPAAISGLTAAYILAVSRAVGETMVVAIAAGLQPNLTVNPLDPAATITAFIVQVSLGDLPYGTVGYQAIFAAGLVLMLITLAFNVAGAMFKRKHEYLL
jgi:phosphate transport system permease protein